MKRVAFVTCSTKPGFAEDDLGAVRLLESAGIEVAAIPWDGDFTEWSTYDSVVLRSTWNYHLHPERFLRWITQLQHQKVNLHNPASVVRWNFHKNYLLELSHKGIPMPPTVWLPKGVSENLASLLKGKAWEKAVVKPAISATAHNTFLTDIREAVPHQEKFQELLQQGDLMVQRFMPEVPSEGEWSLLFFNKQFSHAVLKKPKAADFRVQDNFGGTSEASAAPRIAIAQAEKVLKLVDGSLLYARVDGVISENKFLLMELELIEPVLFLGLDKNAVGRFAKAIVGSPATQGQRNGKVSSQVSTYR